MYFSNRFCRFRLLTLLIIANMQVKPPVVRADFFSVYHPVFLHKNSLAAYIVPYSGVCFNNLHNPWFAANDSEIKMMNAVFRKNSYFSTVLYFNEYFHSKTWQMMFNFDILLMWTSACRYICGIARGLNIISFRLPSRSIRMVQYIAICIDIW